MKRYIYYIWCLLGLSLLSGCMFEEESIETKDENLVHMVFTAMVEDGSPATRTVLDENEVAGVRNVLWEPDDVIGIATYNGTYQSFENVLEEPAASGVFEGSVNQDIMYYAIYPYRDNQQMSTSVNVTIPSKQTYKPNSFDGSAAPMVGKGNHAEPLHFMNLCGALAVQLTGNEKVRSIIFQANANDKVSGDGTVDPDYGDYPVLQMGDVADNFIILDCGEGVQLSGTPTSFHFVLPPGTYNGFKLIISTTDGQFMEKSTDKQLKIKRSIVTKAASLAFENNVKDFINLSEKGHSNCYIVPGAGFYSFDVNVIGNGEFGLFPDIDFHTNEYKIRPDTIDILWEDSVGLVHAYGLDVDRNKAQFIASDKKGNVLFVAKDKSGTILWSWHIWVTDQPEDQVYENSAGTYIVQDRNLGAICAEEGITDEDLKKSRGSLYFWGRKDPFFRDMYTVKSGLLSIEESVMNPNMIHSASSWSSLNYSWMGIGKQNDKAWMESKKTIYDPCPVGYRVATSKVWTDVLEKYSNEGLDSIGKLSLNKGYNIYIDGDKLETSWYPFSDIINYWGRYQTYNDRTQFWCADYNFSPNGGTERLFWLLQEKEVGLHEDYDANAMPVRCMRDDAYVDVSCPQVVISEFKEITNSSAQILVDIKSPGINGVIEKGIIWGKSPDLADGVKLKSESVEDLFMIELAGLSSATKYYIKPYAINAQGASQSATKHFVTLNSVDEINLSLNGTANCYVVPPICGTYSFNCTVRGNSDVNVGAPSFVDVLWEIDGCSNNAAKGTIVSSVELINDVRVAFSLPDNPKEGNALIAVKDSEGVILWSWHIWITDLPVAQVYKNDKGVFKVLDRNVGATRADRGIDDEWMDARGLVFFWGRKDPFWYGSYSTAEGFMSIEDAIANPTMRHSANSWMGNAQTTWMGHGVYMPNLWTKGLKTVYDPCPPGYRVASKDIFYGFTATAATSNVLDEFCVSDYIFDRGWSFYIDEMKNETSWYSSSYYMDIFSGHNEYAVDGFVWTSDYYVKNNKAVFHFSDNVVELGDVMHPSGKAFPVRCIKDE